MERLLLTVTVDLPVDVLSFLPSDLNGNRTAGVVGGTEEETVRQNAFQFRAFFGKL